MTIFQNKLNTAFTYCFWQVLNRLYPKLSLLAYSLYSYEKYQNSLYLNTCTFEITTFYMAHTQWNFLSVKRKCFSQGKHTTEEADMLITIIVLLSFCLPKCWVIMQSIFHILKLTHSTLSTQCFTLHKWWFIILRILSADPWNVKLLLAAVVQRFAGVLANALKDQH